MVLKKLNIKGDTIIEVMIAMAIIGLTIGGAYGIANRSLRAARSAQERGEALKLAEGQLEVIKAAAFDEDVIASGDVFSRSDFCLVNTDGWSVVDTDESHIDDSSPQCVNGLYHTRVERVESEPGSNLYQFTVNVQWYRVGSGEKDQLKIDYRVFKGDE